MSTVNTKWVIVHSFKLSVIFLMQGRKGDPGISPGPATKGEKVFGPVVFFEVHHRVAVFS